LIETLEQEIAMSARDIRVSDPADALLVEQLLAMLHELRDACQTAPDGQVLKQTEQIAVQQGRELTRKALESVLNEQAAEAEKKGRRHDNVLAAELDRIAAGASDRFLRQPGR
jgi:hypothetical protein